MVSARVAGVPSQRRFHRTVLANAGSILTTNAINMALGVPYWWIAARWFDPSAVGFASAVNAGMNLMGTLGMLGLGTLLIGELPRRPAERERLLSTGLLVAAVAGGLLGTGFALMAPHVSSGLRSLAGSPATVALFALGAGLTSLALVLDQAVVGLLRSSLQVWRNSVFGISKLLALVVAAAFAARGGLTIYATWVFGLVVCLLALASQTGALHHACRPSMAAVRRLGWQALGHHVLNSALQINSLAMPLVVTAVLSTTVNAYYSIAGLISALVYVVPTALATVLFALGASDPAAIADRVRFTLVLSLALTALASLVLVFASVPILDVFGHGYARHAAVPLVVFALGAIPLSIREHFAAIQRLRGRPIGAAPYVLAGSALKLVLATKGATMDGLVGLSVGLLVASCGEALALARPVYLVAAGRAPGFV